MSYEKRRGDVPAAEGLELAKALRQDLFGVFQGMTGRPESLERRKGRKK